jgi:autotransporter-associated beta strand protein
VNLLAGSGAGGLTKLGTGALTLSGTSSTFTGVIDVQKGTLAYNNSSALGAGPAAVKLAAGAILKPTATSSVSRAIQAAGADAQINTQSGATATFTGGLALASGYTPGTGQALKIESVGTTVISGTAIDLPGMQVNKGQSGILELNVAGNNYGRFWNYGGTVRTGVAGALDPDAQFDNRTSGSVLDLSGNDQTVGSLVGAASDGLNSIVTSATAATLTISPASGSFNYAGNLTGNLGITKDGAGTQVLSAGATHSYTGATVVNAGTLVINSNISTSSGIELNGGSIGGTGSIGNITLDGGSLAPGNSIGLLNANDLTWNGGLMAFELNSTDNSSDQLNLAGAFLRGSGSQFAFNFLGTGTGGQTYTLVNFASSTFAGTDFSYSNLNSGLSGTFGLSGSNLTFTVVPEPRAALLGGLGIIALLRRRRH